MSHLEIESARLRERGSTTPTSGGGSQIQENEGSVSLKYPMLTRSNYAAWSIKMEVFMRAQGVWEAVDATEQVESRKDMMALAAIYQGISEDTLLQLGAKKTAKEAWDMLKTMNLGAEKVKEVRTQSLWREFEAMKMSDGDSIDDFSGKLQIVVNKLRGLGNNVDEEQVVKKLLRSTSSKFLQIASTIEEFGDLKTKTVDEVIGSLKAHEERIQGYGVRRDETVLLSSAEWKAVEDRKSHKKNSRELSNNTPGRGRGRGQSRGRGRSYGGGSQRTEEEPQQRKWFDKTYVKCYSCGKTGHYSRDCSSKKDERVNLVEEHQGPALLMIETCELTKSQDSYVKTEDEPESCVAQTELRSCEAQTESRWYLDTGASNHMTGEEGFFADIDYSVTGKVKFGDGSVTDIHGLGSVLFQCKNGEHLTLSNVYYIPKLKSNIISLGQLDERGSKVIIEEGTLRVYDRTNKLVFNIRRQHNKLLTFNQ